MKKRFDKIIKIFFAMAMIFSQMYSPLSVFAETIDDTNSGETTSDSDVTLEEDTDTTDDVTEDTNTGDESLDEEVDEVVDTTDDTDTTLDEDTILDDNIENTDEGNTNTGSDNETTGGDNNENIEENDDSEVATLDITVDGNVELISSEDKNYNYNVVTPNDDLNVKFNPIITNTESNVVDLVINDTYTVTDDFSFDFGKLAGGIYKFTFNLYEESSVVDTVIVNVNYNIETEDTYYDVTEDTTLEDLAYKFVSATLDDSVDTNKLLADYLTFNNELGMKFDSEDNTVVVPYGSTTNNVTTVSDLLEDISRVLETTYESDEGDESIYTGLEVSITFMGEEFNYTVIALGDTDTGYVTDSDVQDILDFALENKELDPYGAKASDVNQDGEVNVLDVTNVIKAINTDSFETSSNEDKYSINLTGETTVKVNDTVTISLDVSGFDTGTMNGIEGVLSYDSSVLKLTGVDSDVFKLGTLNPDNNKFMFVDFNSIDSDNTVITFTFKVIGSGNTTVSVNDVKLALDGTLLELDNNTSSININVLEDSNNTNNVDNTTVEPVVAQPINNYVLQYVSYSSDSLIEDLIIKGYEIDFDPNVFEYTINVGSKVKSLDLTAILSDSNATYEVFGNENFKEGENIVTVVVTAEDGSTSTYTIKVNKEKSEAKVEDEKEKDSSLVKTIVIILIILVIIGLIYLIFKDDNEDDEEYSPKNKGSSKKK